MSKKLRALDLILQRGLIADEKEARACLMAGQVYSGSRRIAGASEMLPIDCELHVRGMDMPFVSKGGLKLSGAIRDFGIDVTGRVCIDAGASTGGFTDCLVKSGAALVYAVDVGFGQLMGSLRQDPHVVNLEKTNISDEKLLSLDPKPTLGSVDLSYLSLRKGIPAFAVILKEEGELMCLVKPLFETEDAAARRSGVLPDDAYEGVLNDLIRDVNALPYAQAVNVTHSPVTGNAGTREFFLHVRLGWDKGPAVDLAQKARQAVERALQLSLYEKNNG
ncbi:MAG: TlyA family RNA methyltransferase [Clostridiales bacterium]|nr:TlyA family RNA methyltransferase [Clostridiales bacterium]MDY5468573.1 TlyA family RNA methyltransferase [Eubacteriales bacterium]